MIAATKWDVWNASSSLVPFPFGKLQLEINGMTENSMLTSPDYCRLLWPENSVPGPFVCSPNMRTTGLEISNELSKYRMITNPLECKTVMNAKYIQYQIS